MLARGGAGIARLHYNPAQAASADARAGTRPLCLALAHGHLAAAELDPARVVDDDKAVRDLPAVDLGSIRGPEIADLKPSLRREANLGVLARYPLVGEDQI